MVTQPQSQALRRQLAALREEVEHRVQAQRRDAQPVGLDAPVGRLTRMDMIQQQHMAVGQQQRLQMELQQIMAALERLDHNQYGYCLDCRADIPFERLAIRPVTTLCYDCQQERERRRT